MVGVAALVVLMLAASPVAAAPSNVSYPRDTVVVSGNPGAFSLTISKTTFLSCSGFPPTCSFSADYDIASAQGFNNNAPTRCSDTSGATPPTGLDCTPIPALTSVAGSSQADTITSGCDFFGASARVAALAGDGADTVGTGCGDDELDGGPGDDELDAGSGDDAADGGAGNDTVSGGSGVDALSGGAGDDALQAGSQDDAVAGNEGADTLTGGDGADKLDGGDGKDSLEGGAGGDSLDGGADRDELDGDAGDDTLSGAGGRDLLLPGAGTDPAVVGGDGVDTVSYEDRADGAALQISLNGTADDGASGENDAVASDIENAVGSPGPDTLLGNAGANDLDGGLGTDTIDPGAGPDFVDAGPGDDGVTARDGAQDRIDCGDGIDTAVTDQFDTTSGCEVVQPSRELMPDVDNDGVPVPADCDDRNPAMRPGFPDKPGNGVDEDCVGGDAPYTRIVTPVQSTFRLFLGFTRATRLRVLDVPAGATIQLRCKGGPRRGCFSDVKRVRVPRGAAATNLKRFVRGRKLRPTARLEVRVLRADSIGKVVRWTIRDRRLPAARLRCLIPGDRRPKRC